MTTQELTLASRVRDIVAAGRFEDLEPLCTPATVLDATVPGWRFQRQGGEEIVAQFREWYGDSSPTYISWREHEAPWGTVVESEETRTISGEEFYSRNAWLLFTEGGRIVRLLLYCPGDWDAETRERQRREAPMVEKD